jgi:hypothetical protein
MRRLLIFGCLLPLLAWSHAAQSTGFAITHTPAVSVQATATQAAGGSGVRNIVEGLCFGYSATTALGGATTVTINLRDGASGAGTVLKSWQFTLAATTHPPRGDCVSRLHIQGSPNTAMTLEFASATGNLMEFVSLEGYTQP